MYRTALRAASRQAVGGLRTQTPRSAPRLRRLASTASPADRPRSWKSSALRWGLAVAAVYFYNTSPVFADEAEDQESDLSTVESVVEKKRQQLKANTEENPTASNTSEEAEPDAESQTTEAASSAATTAAASPEALEEEAGQEGAFNPETGEINWDCPCLGGMAHGPCGEEFKTAFSCFVYSTEDPKGMDCIDKFQGMQECFRKYPDIYGAEIADDEDGGETAPEGEQTVGQGSPSAEERRDPETHQSPADEPTSNPSKRDTPEAKKSLHDHAVVGDGVPAPWQDATQAEKTEAQEGQPGKKESKE
ncbi:hypothetical protein E4U42_006209 [Claviceps africana]|uniref:Mitochondrial intermembrane space import and assembly protein 40 n=1 Tax=Claviceps africana TaxID=83212 RepID=A0A8K0NF42_9HYPO|nr:hypothetical protein E4U42_006209 [Claviceps africana]